MDAGERGGMNPTVKAHLAGKNGRTSALSNGRLWERQEGRREEGGGSSPDGAGGGEQRLLGNIIPNTHATKRERLKH